MYVRVCVCVCVSVCEWICVCVSGEGWIFCSALVHVSKGACPQALGIVCFVPLLCTQAPSICGRRGARKVCLEPGRGLSPELDMESVCKQAEERVRAVSLRSTVQPKWPVQMNF